MRWILFLALFMAVSSGPEVKIYKGTSTFFSDVLYTVRDGKVYKERSAFSSDIVCSVIGHEIHEGDSKFTSSVRYTVRDGKVYKGTTSTAPSFWRSSWPSGSR